MGSAKDLYVIFIGDTLDRTVGMASKSDILQFNRVANRIAKATDLKIQKILLVGLEAVSLTLFEKIDHLPITSEDIVIFYFSGHGYRTEAKHGLFPYIYLGVEHQGVDLDIICQRIKLKNPQLLISFVDCCNNFIPVSPHTAKEIQSQEIPQVEKAAFKKLFLNSKGHLMIASANPGEFSWCTPMGSYATNAFLQALKQEAMHGSLADWMHVMDMSAKNLLSTRPDQHIVFVAELTPYEPLHSK